MPKFSMGSFCQWGGPCRFRIDVLETASAKRESHSDRPLTSPKNQSKSSPPSAEKTRTKSSSDSPASGNRTC